MPPSRKPLFFAFLLIYGAVTLAAADEPSTLPQIIQSALKNYPSIRISQEQTNAAAAQLRLARTAYLPHIDALAQVNRATRNNVFGLLLPQSTISSVTGPVGSSNLNTVWNSVVGALISWEPFDFGRRAAAVAESEASRRQADAEVKRTRFEVAVSAADAYLTLLAAQETIRAAQASVDRAATLERITKAQVDAQLRPGADTSRATAELAAARTQLIQAEQAANLAKATLAQFTGALPEQIAIAGGSLLNPAPAPQDQKLPTMQDNPALLAQNATLEQVQAQLRTLERTYFPKFALQGLAYGRGIGVPNTQNYAVGLTITFPLMDLSAIRAREEEKRAQIRSEQARADQLIVDLRAQWRRAVANLNASQQIAANTPIEVSSARAAVDQATARYKAGLGNITEVADAQRLLAQAEIDDSLARLSVWRSLLGIATAAGDIEPFVTEASR